MVEKNNKTNSEHVAVAKALNLHMSAKQGIEICRSLRYKNTAYAKNFLEDVVSLKRAVPFRRFNRDMGHKAGMAAGRFPQKAASEFLKLVKSVEFNAQAKGLNISNLKITKILANKASIPLTGGRHRTGTKRSHIEIEVKEGKGVKGKGVIKNLEVKKVQSKVEKEVKSESKEKLKVDKKNEEVLNEDKPKVVKKMKDALAKETHVELVKEATSVTEEEKVMGIIKELVTEEPSEEEIVVIEKETIAEEPVQELSSSDLLKKVQEKADQLNKKEKEKKSTEEVSNLYQELQRKGSLRSKGEKQ